MGMPCEAMDQNSGFKLEIKSRGRFDGFGKVIMK